MATMKCDLEESGDAKPEKSQLDKIPEKSELEKIREKIPQVSEIPEIKTEIEENCYEIKDYDYETISSGDANETAEFYINECSE